MKLEWIFAFVLGITMIPTACADVQTYETDLGEVSIDVLHTLYPNDFSSGTTLNLAKPGTQKPLFVILLQDTWGEDLKTYAAGMAAYRIFCNFGRPVIPHLNHHP